MAKRDSINMRLDRRLAEAIKKKQEEVEKKIKVKITIPQASGSLFEEFQLSKLKKLDKEIIKF